MRTEQFLIAASAGGLEAFKTSFHRMPCDAGIALAIVIWARRKDGLWRFSVDDNGTGIKARHLQNIFASFQRLLGLDQYPGSGIGLALCKKVVERSGARSGPNPPLGMDSTFHFTLPAQDGAA
jgi:signal transduction histidine kinase